MIAHERQYRITQAAVRDFEDALARLVDRGQGQQPLAQQLLRDSLEGQLETLREQLAAYETPRPRRAALSRGRDEGGSEC
jgi:hypothetical protein